MTAPNPRSDRIALGFRERLDEARHEWLRRRFRLYYTILLWSSLLASVILAQALLHVQDGQPRTAVIVGLISTLLCAVVSALPLVYVRRRPPPSIRGLIRVTYVFTWGLALLLVAPAAAMASIVSDAYREVTGMQGARLGPAFPWMVWFLLAHSLAAGILPWRPKQAFVAYAFFAACVTPLLLFATGDSPEFRLLGLFIIWTVGLPGVGISWVRQTRFARRFHLSALSEHYEETTRELTDAQRIHEALLPEPVRDASVTLDYAYEPMRAVGGDFLFVHQHASADARLLSYVLVDVTGHGVPAALTVHRLHGELERIFGEQPDAAPSLVLSQLNRYFHVALAKHSIYATALSVRARLRTGAPASLSYASAGHPPAILVATSGGSQPLASTCFVLGAAGPEDFDPAPRSIELSPGDTVVAYTDGAFECLNAAGAMLGLDAFRAIVADLARSPNPPHAILEAVRDARARMPPNDDTLIVSLRIP